jgi:hypothetical protein
VGQTVLQQQSPATQARLSVLAIEGQDAIGGGARSHNSPCLGSRMMFREQIGARYRPRIRRRRQRPLSPLKSRKANAAHAAKMSVAIRLVIGNVLDRLLKASQSVMKASQSIVEDVLKHLHDPDATEAQLKSNAGAHQCLANSKRDVGRGASAFCLLVD